MSLKAEIDFESLRFSADAFPENLMFFLRFDSAINDAQRKLIESSLQNQAISRSLKGAKFVCFEKDDNAIELNESDFVTIFIGANVEIYDNFLRDLLAVFYLGQSHVVYSNFESRLEKTSHFLPVWSPQRFINFDYLGPIVAIRSNDLQSVKEMSRDSQELRNYIWETHLRDRRISRIPRNTYKLLDHDKSFRRTADQRKHQKPSSISVVIPTRGVRNSTLSSRLLKDCLDSITRQDLEGVQLEVIVVVDFQFSIDIDEYCKEVFPLHISVLQVVYDEPFNFSKKCNLGAANSSGEVIIFLNDDAAFVSQDGLMQMSSMSIDQGVGAVGALLLFDDSSIQHCGISMTGLRPSHYFIDHFVRDLQPDLQDVSYEVSAVTGACLAIQRVKFEEIGYWDESFPNSYNDLDLCLRLNSRGYQSVQMNSVVLRHFESATRDASFDAESFRILNRKFSRALQAEKYLFRDSCTPCDHKHGMQFELHNAFLGKPVLFLLYLVRTRGLIDSARYLASRFAPISSGNSQICNTII